MEDRTHEEIKSLVAAYVLGAVPEDEQSAIRSHLITCDECMAEADSYSIATTALGDAVEPEALPPGFEDRVLTRVTSERAGREPVRARRRLNLGWVVALSSLLLAAALGAAYVNIRNDLAEQERLIASALARIDEGMTLEGEGRGAVVPADGETLFVATGLAAPPEDQTYQLWLLGRTEPVSAGTFDVEDGRVLIEIDRPVAGFAGAAVTIEPAGGSAAPTTDPVLSTPG
jgi:anti-sigma-K factor RskA